MIEHNHTSRLTILMCLLSFLCSRGLAQVSKNIDFAQGHFTSYEAQYPKARIGIQVVRYTDTTEVFSYHSTDAFIPASIVKILSTGAALKTRGMTYRYSTELYTNQTNNLDTLNQNIVLLCSGDPSLGSKHLDGVHTAIEEKLAQELNRHGVRHIESDILIEAHLPIEQGAIPSWLEEDLSWSYGAGVYGFNYADNAIDLYISTTGRIGRRAKLNTSDDRSQLIWKNKLNIGKRENMRSYHSIGCNEVELNGIVPRGSSSYRLKLYNPNPAGLFSYRLRNALARHGITWQGEAKANYSPSPSPPADWTLLGRYLSPELAKLASITNHHSHNLYAEAIAHLLATPQGRGAGLSTYWKQRLGIDQATADEQLARSLSLADGSGLSRSNRLSPEAMNLALLDLMGGHVPHDGALVSSLPQIGLEGTVRNLMPHDDLTAYLKSGSMRGVLCYAGYIYHKGEWYVITYMSNGIPSISSSRAVLVAFLRQAFGQTYLESVANDEADIAS